MELNNFHNLHFDLYKIKGVDVFEIFKNKVVSKLRELNIKYDIKLVDEMEEEMIGGGGSQSNKTTYPYNYFEGAIDTIVGKQRDNKEERKNMFLDLFSSKKDSGAKQEDKSNMFNFNLFNRNKVDEDKPIRVKQEFHKPSEPVTPSPTLVTPSPVTPSPTPSEPVTPTTVPPTPSPLEPNTISESIEKNEQQEQEEGKEEPEQEEQEEVEEQEQGKEEPEQEEGEEEQEQEQEEDEEKKEDNVIEPSRSIINTYDNEDKEVDDFIKTQKDYIRVVITIYHDDKNDKILPTIIGMKKWAFMPK